jgi:hypothetical protein
VRALDDAHHAVYPGPPVPGRFAASLVATEDHRFYSEAGIDPFAIVSGLGYLLRKPDQGGSTLYQQLARLLYTPGQVGLLGKAEQVLLGIKLDVSYSKAQVLQMYADAAYFGHGYYGLQAASCGYFGVAPAALTWPLAATLAGLMQAPSANQNLPKPGAVAWRRRIMRMSRLRFASGGVLMVAAGLLVSCSAAPGRPGGQRYLPGCRGDRRAEGARRCLLAGLTCSCCQGRASQGAFERQPGNAAPGGNHALLIVGP